MNVNYNCQQPFTVDLVESDLYNVIEIDFKLSTSHPLNGKILQLILGMIFVVHHVFRNFKIPKYFRLTKFLIILIPNRNQFA